MPELKPKRAYRRLKVLGLSVRQRQIVELTAQGFGWQQISDKIGITMNTQQSYCRHLFKKMKVHNAAHLIAKCYEMGILKPKI